MMKTTDFKEYYANLDLPDDDRAEIELEANIICAIAEAREEKGMTQRQLADICGISQPVIAKLEKAVHSPQLNTLLKVLAPLGYTLAVVPKGERPRA
jgi:DNA-binding XRE family transcriptional regulator